MLQVNASPVLASGDASEAELTNLLYLPGFGCWRAGSSKRKRVIDRCPKGRQLRVEEDMEQSSPNVWK